MVNVYTGDWMYLSLDSAKLLRDVLVAAYPDRAEAPIVLELIEAHIAKLEGECQQKKS